MKKMNVFILCLICITFSSFLTYIYSKEEFINSLYENVDDIDQNNAKVLADQHPDVLQPYLDEINKQERKLIELEFLTFNYYKNRTVFHNQNKN